MKASMFERISPGMIESDEGFTVMFNGRSYIAYQEGTRTANIEYELLSRPLGAMLYPASLRRWQPDGQEILDDERRTILQNVKRALEFASYSCSIGFDSPP